MEYCRGRKSEVPTQDDFYRLLRLRNEESLRFLEHQKGIDLWSSTYAGQSHLTDNRPAYYALINGEQVGERHASPARFEMTIPRLVFANQVRCIQRR